MSQYTIVTTPQNSGLGTPLATAFNYTNSNFTELYARYQTSVPVTLVGQTGDVPGMYAVDSTYFYYCFANYNGSNIIWAQVTQVGNISVDRIVSGTSNVAVTSPSGNVAVGINGLGNIAVFTDTGLRVTGVVSATGNVRGSYILGNGSQLTGLPATYTDANVATFLSALNANSISTAGNVTAGYFLGNGSELSNLTATNISGAVANATYATTAGTAGTLTTNAQPNITSVGTLSSVSATGNIVGGNVATTGMVSASGNIITAGYFIGNFTGNIVANITNVPGPGGAVLFNDGSGNVAATAGLVFNNTGPNVLTVLGDVSATANILANAFGANFISGTLTTNAQPNITSVGTLNSVCAFGNVTGGNLRSAGLISATGTITGGNLAANGIITGSSASVSGGVTAASVAGGIITGTSLSVTGNVTTTNLFGTLGTATQNSITSVGTLSSLAVTANIQTGNVRTTGIVSAAGNITSAGNIRGGNLTIVTDIATGGNVNASYFTGVAISVTGNISTTSNIAGGYILGNGSQLTGVSNYTDSNVATFLANLGGNNISTTGTVSALLFSGGGMIGNTVSVIGNVVGNNLIGTLVTSSQPNITAVGTLTSLSVSGNITSGNLYTSGESSATGNVTGGNLYTGGQVSATGNITGASLIGSIATSSQPAITAVGTLTSLSVSGNITSGNLSVGIGSLAVGNIINTNGNLVGNIGSNSSYFNTVFAQATSAQYADLAENYLSDSDYTAGTVVIFGGEKEITVTSELADERVAGVISENPAHLMNAGSPGLAVALRGRVPLRVIGPVIKGDSLVTSTVAGVAISVKRDRNYAQAVFAKSIETDLSDGEKTITAVIL